MKWHLFKAQINDPDFRTSGMINTLVFQQDLGIVGDFSHFTHTVSRCK